MNILEFAMQMEKDGEAYYRELAEKAGNAGLATILNALADEEVKHYNIFNAMNTGSRAEFTTSTLLTDVKNIFLEMKDKGEKTFDFEKEAKEHYLKAQELEKKSEDFYLEKMEEVDDEHQKSLLKKIAAEEHHHYNVLGNMIELVQRPDTWLEDAEWRNLDEY